MATEADLAIAKRLLSAHVVPEETLRAAFEQLGALREQGQEVSLERLLYARKVLPPGSLAVLNAPPLLESQPFKNYDLHAKMGEGGSSSVYEATYRPNGAGVAIKVLDPIQALRREFLERFQQEATMLTQLDHENVVMGYELGLEAGYHFFSMDLIDGLTVLEIIDRRGFLSNEESLSITYQTASALEYLHASGYLHRDVKPSNIMVDAAGRARLIDLGLVRDLTALTPGATAEETTTVGTVEYLSPEQARGRADLDQRSDIYSLGVTLYHMIVGEVPFQGDSEYEVMAKQIMASLDTQKVKQRRISPEIHFFITKMTSKDRDSRFENLTEVREALSGYVSDEYMVIDFGPEPAAAPVMQPIQPPPTAAPVVQPTAPPVMKPVSPPPTAQPVQPPTAQPAQPPAPSPGNAPSAPVPRRKGGAPTPSKRRGTRRRDDGGPSPRRRRRR